MGAVPALRQGERNKGQWGPEGWHLGDTTEWVLAVLQEGMRVLRRDLEKGKAQGSPRGAGEGVRAAPQPPGSC